MPIPMTPEDVAALQRVLSSTPAPPGYSFIAVAASEERALSDAAMGTIFEDYYHKTVGDGSGHHYRVLKATTPTGVCVGALEQDVFWGGSIISRLIVPKPWRGSSIGGMLLAAGERDAAALGAKLMTVSTFTHQAPSYYPLQGYHLVHVRPGFRDGLSCHFFRKDLPASMDCGASPIAALPGGSVLAEADVTPRSGAASATRIRITVATEEEAGAPMSAWFDAEFRAHGTETRGHHADYKPFTVVAVKDAAEGLGGASPAVPRKLTSVDTIVAVLDASTYWNGLFVEHLVVQEEHRRCGLGKALLNIALAVGRARRCGVANVETFDFQSPAYYLARGFACDFSLEGWRDGKVLHWYSMPLAAEGEEEKESAQ